MAQIGSRLQSGSTNAVLVLDPILDLELEALLIDEVLLLLLDGHRILSHDKN